MVKNRKTLVCFLAGILLCLLVVVLLLGQQSSDDQVSIQQPDADHASEVFESYVHTDVSEDGSYLQASFVRQDGRYVMIEKYRDIGGRFFYKQHVLSDSDKGRFDKNLENFEVLDAEPTGEGSYHDCTLTFSSEHGSSHYYVKPFDITGYGIETDPDDSLMITDVSDDCNRLMPVTELAEQLSFTSSAELGGYLQMVYDQIVDLLYGSDEEAANEAWHTMYGMTLKTEERSDRAYVLELQCDKGIYDVTVLNEGYVCSLDQTVSSGDVDLSDETITKSTEILK